MTLILPREDIVEPAAHVITAFTAMNAVNISGTYGLSGHRITGRTPRRSIWRYTMHTLLTATREGYCRYLGFSPAHAKDY